MARRLEVRLLKASATLVAVLAASAACGGAAMAGSCMKVTGHGTGVTEGVAKFMAEAAVKNGIAARGLKAAGSVTTSCTTTAYVLSNCTATRRACP